MIDMELWKQELDELPHKGKNINWIESIGYKIKGVYNNIKFKIEIVDYIRKNKRTYLYIKYLNNPIFEINTNGFQKCQLGKLLNIYTNEFKIEVGDVIKDDKRNLKIIDRKYIKNKNGWDLKYYKYRCNKCGFSGGEYYKNGIYHKEHWIIESSLLNGKGCACCCPTPRIVVSGINDVATTNPELASLFLNKEDTYKYTQNSHNKINFKCPNCGEIIESKFIDNINKRGLSCPKCSDKLPYPEKFIFNVLEQLNIDFIYQLTKTTFDWCDKYKYDFYFELNNEDYIIETNGLGHYEDGFSSCGGKTVQEEQENDRIKKQLAIKNGIKENNYIVVNCKKSELKWIKDSIINSRLNDLFDLFNINWLKCHEYACNSLIKKTCDLWNKGIYSIFEIGKIMKLEKSTIIRYLKQGRIINLCNYEPKKEKEKGIRKKGKNGKLVQIYKNGILLAPPFESCAELQRQSEKLFGVKLLTQYIYDVCNGTIRQYKGFTFEYI